MEHWLNLETAAVCIDAIGGLRKANLERTVGDPMGLGLSSGEVKLTHGIVIHFRAGGGMELDYDEESHRDQVYNAIWKEIKEGSGDPA